MRGHAESEKRDVVATGLLLVGLATTVVILGVRRGERAPAECAPLLDHYVELRMRAAYEKLPPALVEEKQEQSRRAERAAEAMGDCARRLTTETAECALKAPSADELERCFP